MPRNWRVIQESQKRQKLRREKRKKKYQRKRKEEEDRRKEERVYSFVNSSESHSVHIDCGDQVVNSETRNTETHNSDNPQVPQHGLTASNDTLSRDVDEVR